MELNINIILGVIFVSLITETAVNSIKRLHELPATACVGLSLVISIFICIGAGLDLMAGFGYPLLIPFGNHIGSFVTGIVASLGANAIYDLLAQFRDYKDRIAVENNPPL